jgi:hypothetical protein
MIRPLIFLCFIASLVALFPGARPSPLRSALAACEAGEKPDKTTVEDTRKLLDKAGYKNAHNWRKGCDNAWHATATKDGAEVNVAVLPDGHIVREGD